MRAVGLILLVLALFVGVPAQAQSRTEPSTRARELATEYVEVLNLERLVQDLYAGMSDAVPEWERLQREIVGTTKGETITSPMPTFNQELDMEVLRPFLEIIEGLLIETHARTYSEAQLAALIRFHESRGGAEILAQRDDFVVNLMTVILESLPDISEQLGFPEAADDTTVYPIEPDLPTRRMDSGSRGAEGLSVSDIQSGLGDTDAADDAALAAIIAAEAAVLAGGAAAVDPQ